MKKALIIIGSGFASYQLIKTIRRSDKNLPISVFTLDAGHDYNKPDLSHVFSKQQTSRDLIRQSGDEFASENNITLNAFTKVDSIDTNKQEITVKGVKHAYCNLVLATGAKTFIPDAKGNATNEVLTLNTLHEFEAAHSTLRKSNTVLLLGAGLIGTEIAMDLASSGKNVVVVDPSNSLIANMLPVLIAEKLQKKMVEAGIRFELNKTVYALNHNEDKIAVTLSTGEVLRVDCVISAAGLKANTGLAKQSGIEVNKGIKVNALLQTSARHVYALGDCAEINGKVRAYLQPIMLSANALAKTLLAQPTELTLPAMLIKVKTPLMPIQLGGEPVLDVNSWQVDIDAQGYSLSAYNEQKETVGFVVTEGHMKNAFPLLRKLSTPL